LVDDGKNKVHLEGRRALTLYILEHHHAASEWPISRSKREVLEASVSRAWSIGPTSTFVLSRVCSLAFFIHKPVLVAFVIMGARLPKQGIRGLDEPRYHSPLPTRPWKTMIRILASF